MLSSQTKDEVVGKAMTKLKQNKLTVDNVLDTPQEEIARMIFPVGFWNVGVVIALKNYILFAPFIHRRKPSTSRRQPRF